MTAKAFYPLSELYRFEIFDRESYKAKFGSQAPPYDPRRRIKRWRDPKATGELQDPYRYKYFDFAAKEFRDAEITIGEARTLNLPGRYEWGQYKVQPTPALIVGPPPLAPQPLNPEFLSHRTDAEYLASLWNGTVVESAPKEGPFWVDWMGETRRCYEIRLGDGRQYNVGLLMKARHAAGHGAPGKWEMTPFGPVWVPDPQPDGSTDGRPEVPVPCRELLANEALHITPFGVTVYRTDLESPYNPASTFEGKVLAALERIEAALRAR
jgi:hypothetical protein